MIKRVYADLKRVPLPKQPTTVTLRNAFQQAFLPQGYPQSVRPSYTPFILWQTLHTITGAACGVLSTQSLLVAMHTAHTGVPLAAALNWVIKDGLGQLGGVLYAARAGTKFDTDPKRHRFRATCAMQMAATLELISVWWPGHFLLLASIANVAKNIAWLAGSATRAQMHSSMILRDNLGDVTAKSGSQTTAASLVGTALGIGLGSIIEYIVHVHGLALTRWWTGNVLLSVVSPTIMVACSLLAFLPLTSICLYASYKSNVVAVNRTLNRSRADIIFYRFIRDWNEESTPKLLAPENVAPLETFVGKSVATFKTRLIVDVTGESLPESDSERQALIGNEKYYLGVLMNNQVYLTFNTECSVQERIFGYFHACWICYRMDLGHSCKETVWTDIYTQILLSRDNLWHQMEQLEWHPTFTDLGNVSQGVQLL